MESTVFFREGLDKKLYKKKIALFTNHTGVDKEGTLTVDRIKNHPKLNLVCIFAPEHGIHGCESAGTLIGHSTYEGCRLFSLHGKCKRPTREMLANVDVIICDIQDIGCRSYTYFSTLCYLIEAAAQYKIQVYIFDRPNPMGGMLVDGPLFSIKDRSILSYVNVPYCHGMTIGELALYFNKEYKVGADIHVITMKNWTRSKTFEQTKLLWSPPSPNIPDEDSPYYYATTGIIGELGIVDIGIGSSLPFKVIAAPWIDQKFLVKTLKAQRLKGVGFLPYIYKPTQGRYAGKLCKGVKICITDRHSYQPVRTGVVIMSVLKSTYPKQISEKLMLGMSKKKELLIKIIGDHSIVDAFYHKKSFGWTIVANFSKECKEFVKKREKFLLYKD